MTLTAFDRHATLLAQSGDKPPPSTAWRADIDGLRAVAVVSVLVFHALPDVLPGGFVGVDVFFVISGYLITALLLGELRDERFSQFSLWAFYGRRVRRIFPALVVVIALTRRPRPGQSRARLRSTRMLATTNEFDSSGGAYLRHTARSG